MITRESIVKDFMKAMEVPIDEDYNVAGLELAMKLIKEECREVEEEVIIMLGELGMGGTVDFDTSMRLLKELADLQYVVSYFATRFGMNLESAFRRVHFSNMSKLDDYGKPVRRSDGKIMKSENYQPPYLRDLV